MNYRHHFHAGNFADLLKHALLLAAIEQMTADRRRITVLDTHAGAGRYDLESESAKRTGEAAVARLMADADAPSAFDGLKAAVRAANPDGEVRYYPGSPLLALGALRRGDRYIGCELRLDDGGDLARCLKGWDGPAKGEAVAGDGYAALGSGKATGRRLVLIDPPFERGDEYARVLQAVAADKDRAGEATYAIWTPLKDLQTFDSFLGGVEGLGLGGGLAVEARLRPLNDPMKLNGCAMVFLAAPDVLQSLAAPARAISDWVVKSLGEAGAEARIENLR